MGLASALTTALTGMSAAETQIDVVGNNLANSQTVGFKASDTVFATQFLQTLGLGSAPTATTGGTNPRQTGLGTQVAEISPDFTQGTVELSSSPSDLAIQGDGFFIVEGSTGEQLYTRNGVFKLNSENELVTVTGGRVLGYGVDELFQIQPTQLSSISIPLGSTAVAQATSTVFLEGSLPPTGDLANTAEVIESAILGDGIVPRPDTAASSATVSPTPSLLSVTAAQSESVGGTHPEGAVYRYRFTFADANGTESSISGDFQATVAGVNGLADNTITLNNLPDSGGEYPTVNVYRTDDGGSEFRLLGSAASGGSFVDDNSITPGAPLDTASLTGNYSYLVTYYRAGIGESRPSELIGPINVSDGRIHLQNIPLPPAAPPDGSFPDYNQVRIYRNLASDSSSYYLVDTINPGEDYTDSRTDTAISDLSNPANQQIDLDGPKINSNTLLVNVVRRDELGFENVFEEGTLSFTGRKGGRQLASKDFEIGSTTTVQELLDFIEDSVGLQASADDPQNPIPGSVSDIIGEPGTLSPGGSVQTDGRIRFVSNNGIDNALAIGLTAFQISGTDGDLLTPNLGFGRVQEAQGRSAATDFVAYDSLGSEVNVRLTMVLESRNGTQSTYRWFADSPDNDPTSGTEISVGTGLVVFDGEGNLVTTSNTTVSVDRRNLPANSPLSFDLDFTQVSGLSTEEVQIAASRQDGFAPGVLTDFVVGEDGVIRGVFTNGISRTVGQIQLARFANPEGLQQRGQNNYGVAPNSGLPVIGSPGENGLGTIIAGAVELSNTDIGANLIDLVLATTQYRGNARVITAAQQLLDELLNIRR